MTPPRFLSAIPLVVLAVSCTPSVSQESRLTPTPFLCPVTQPNGVKPTDWNDPSIESASWHGNGVLFTLLWPDGVVIFRPGGAGVINPDGSLGMKWPWYRSVEGLVTVDATRLDAPAPPMQTIFLRGPEDGYGKVGFHPSGLLFPTPGCWEVTATVQDSSLTFVTLVVRLGPPQ